MSYNTSTQTNTYTVIDIRKTFESFEADLRMIAQRTKTWDNTYVNEVSHDVVLLAEKKYLKSVDITLLDRNDKPIRASRFLVSTDGKSMKGDRAGGNRWPEIPGTRLNVIVSYTTDYHLLNDVNKSQLQQELKLNWSASKIDTSYSHLRQESAQSYSSKGYELNKTNFL